MPVALSGSLGVALCPCPADGLLLGRRHRTARQDSGQKQGNHHLAQDDSQAWLSWAENDELCFNAARLDRSMILKTSRVPPRDS